MEARLKVHRVRSPLPPVTWIWTRSVLTVPSKNRLALGLSRFQLLEHLQFSKQHPSGVRHSSQAPSQHKNSGGASFSGAAPEYTYIRAIQEGNHNSSRFQDVLGLAGDVVHLEIVLNCSYTALLSAAASTQVTTDPSPKRQPEGCSCTSFS